jgi:hypothetical protein
MAKLLTICLALLCIGATCTSGEQAEPNDGKCTPDTTKCGGYYGQSVMLCDPDGKWTKVMDCDMAGGNNLTCQQGPTDNSHSCYPGKR